MTVACHRHRHRRVVRAEQQARHSSRRDAPPRPQSMRPCGRNCCCSRQRLWRISSIIRNSIVDMLIIIIMDMRIIIMGMVMHMPWAMRNVRRSVRPSIHICVYPRQSCHRRQ